MDGNEPHNVGFFEFLSEKERAELLQTTELTTFEPSQILIEEGSEPSSLFILTSGQVEVRKRLPDGGDKLLAVLDAKNGRTVVGERGLLSDSETSATVKARSEVEAVKVPRETFRAMIHEGRPAAYKLAYRVAHILAERLARLDEEIVEAAREIERHGETDLEMFRHKLMTEWTV
ncbi:MAG: cyclic nucleotide-binding domain-containing protein [Rubrobacter sp.]|nr:cyclic nucleotide-binding domain-containing protein [Rubrobacter sp.]